MREKAYDAGEDESGGKNRGRLWLGEWGRRQKELRQRWKSGSGTGSENKRLAERYKLERGRKRRLKWPHSELAEKSEAS
jgi:hypothetical protein